MGLLRKIRNKGLTQLSESTTTSGIGKQEFMDWAAMTEEQSGYYSALTMSRNLRGAGLTFRCKSRDASKKFTLSMSGSRDKYFFKIDKNYRIRLQFDNSVILYANLHAYKQKHATILDVSEDLLENIFDSKKLKIEFIGESNKKVTIYFSLKGASSAIESVIARCGDQKSQVNTWFTSNPD